MAMAGVQDEERVPDNTGTVDFGLEKHDKTSRNCIISCFLFTREKRTNAPAVLP